jgi:hypothetical protein
MTRDEHREACLGAIKAALEWHGVADSSRVAPDVLDSIHGIARVVPAEATPKMIEEYELSDYENIGEVWSALSALGDLTNPPDGKP